MATLASGLPHFGAESVVEPGQQAVAGPLAEMMIDGRPWREVFGQEPPLGAGLDQIEEGVEDFAAGGARAAAFFCGGQESAKQVPWGVGEAGIVMGDFHRLKRAAANESRKNTPVRSSNLCVLLFQTASKPRKSARGLGALHDAGARRHEPGAREVSWVLAGGSAVFGTAAHFRQSILARVADFGGEIFDGPVGARGL